MRIFISIAFILLIFTACASNVRNNNNIVALTDNNPIIKLDSILERAVLDIISLNEQHTEYNIPLIGSCVIIQFVDNYQVGDFVFSDSAVVVSCYVCNGNYSISEYKGALRIGSYNVAIFDRNNFGENFYNSDSLYLKNFSDFKCFSMDIIPINSFYIQNGELQNWKKGLK